ncbi:unnamed protein product [Kuraishia capsulata CBS 1993]|uniref:Protein-S-isoprenylcysteine O-methyltransferase n=1 Tax=Kuraishia capsulata CBS 1993 TaxID=1382522 RepID=W6MG28_9ASCO|nr:uncharacterized protein KUCA_T00000911001 [Kuraishia capsulata CBS 1993]CDK24944.1 unnamed protein product [Kuraishia capsulata CBS 1993]
MTSEATEKDQQANPLHEISLTAFLVGAFGGVSLGFVLFTRFSPLAVYFVALSVFHFLEYYITAKHNSSKVTKDSFLLNNGTEYIAAHILAVAEYLLESYFTSNWKNNRILIIITGTSITCLGQFLRSRAMFEAGESFSHVIAQTKREDHLLVTKGVYSLSRHPSYAGFFWWALGTQMLLQNPVCLVGFGVVLWKFFSRRIRCKCFFEPVTSLRYTNIYSDEETKLVSFFGDDYRRYRKSTKTLIPFI